MLEITMNEREKQLQEFNDFTKNIKQKIADITSSLGWTVESISQDNGNFLTCPYDSSHRITEQCLDTHLPACQWKAEGYGELDVPFPESALPPNAPSSLQLDEELQDDVLRKAKEQNPEMKTEDYECYTWHGLYIYPFSWGLTDLWPHIQASVKKKVSTVKGSGQRLIPRTSTRLISDFTSDERKALYEYAITHTAKPDIGRDITDINKPKTQDKDNKEMSLLELLVQERNLKRRRAKHRGVHTNKKSHVEILREVINQQMEIYTDYILEQQDVSSTENKYCSEQDLSRDSHKQQLLVTNHYEKPSVSTYSSYNEKNGHHQINTVHDQQQDTTVDKNYSQSIKYKKHERYSPYPKETSRKGKRSEHRHRSRSKDHKSHKKHKHKSKDRHVKRKHKSRDRDRSSQERSRSKYSDVRTKDSYWSRDR